MSYSSPSSLGSRFENAFTLMEMMVAIPVLVLFVILIFQMTSSVTSVTIASSKGMDADSTARTIFDRMATDFDEMVKRKDVDYIFYKNLASGPPAINDAMFFYSKAPAYFNTSPAPGAAAKGAVRLIGYRVNANLQLERLGKGLTWDGSASPSPAPNPGSAMFLTYSTPTSATASTISGNWVTTIGHAANNYTDGVDSDYNVISDETFRMEIAFVLTDGSVSQRPVVTTTPATWPGPSSSPSPAPTYYTASAVDPISTNDNNSAHSTTYAIGSHWLNTTSNQAFVCANATPGAAIWSRIGIQDVSAIVVAIAILDPTSQKIVANRGSLIGALRDPTDADFQATPAQLMATTWLNAVNSPTFAQTSGIPAAAASQVRIYQRYFYLNR